MARASLKVPATRAWRWTVRSRLAVIASVAAAPLVLAGTASADLPGGCDFSPAGTSTPSCTGPLGGSPFAGGDGNLLTNPTTFGSTDWQNAEGVNIGTDVPSGSNDNTFTQGTANNSPTVVIGRGTATPSSDLSRFYEASQFTNGQNYLYLAWQRTGASGTTNFDFELNQRRTPGFTSTANGSVPLNRTAGDLVIDYDFTQGGGVPTINAKRWVTSGPTSQCFGSPGVSLPCWSQNIPLNGQYIAAVNNLDSVTDPLRPLHPNCTPSDTACHFLENPLPASQFGELAINLNASGLFPTGTCEAFGQAWVKSRVSDSFTSSLADFIAPIPIFISNCLHVSDGYADNERGGEVTLSPWQDGVDNFVGCNQTDPQTGQSSACKTEPNTIPGDHFVYDGGALLYENTSADVGAPQSFTLSHVNVQVGGCRFHPWNSLQPGTLTVPAGTQGTPGTMLLTQTGFSSGANAGPWGTGNCHTVTTPGGYANFDTSETVPARLAGPPCPQDNLVPELNWQIGQQVYTLHDSLKVLNTDGHDIGSQGCGLQNETLGYQGMN